MSTGPSKWKFASVVMPAEVVRLWDELKKDYVTDLRMDLRPFQGPDMRAYLRVSIVSQRFDQHRPGGYEYCWAWRDFEGIGYSISPSKLFDLLIVAKVGIEHVLSGVDDDLPNPFGE